MMKIYQLILLICALIVRLSAFTDPSVLNPQLLKRFEYKLSFKGPNLTFKDGTIPFWSFGGSTIASDDQIRITPSIHSQKGWLWSKNPMTADNWLLDVKLRITGRGRLGADGMAIWFTEQTGVEGPVFGSNDNWKGLGVFLDSFDNDALTIELQNNPILAVMVNDGTKSYDHQRDGSGQIQGSCIRDFRNKPLPIRLKIEYVNQALTVYINNGISQDDNAFEFCTRLDNIQLPKSGYLGVTAATGGLADDHDVLEFITNTFTDRQAPGQNQAAVDEQARKYKEEYEKYEQELKKQQEDYKKEHPDLTTPISEQALYESEYDREFRTILEGQDQIRNSLTNIDRKMAELLGRVERLAITGGNQQPVASGGSQGVVPADVARVQDVNRVINSNTEITRTIQSYAQVLTDLQQKVNNLQTNFNNPRAANAAPGVDASVLNEVRDTIRMIKSETNTLMQKSNNPVVCPSVSAGTSGVCLGPYTFLIAIAGQLVVIIGYLAFKSRQERVSRKYL